MLSAAGFCGEALAYEGGRFAKQAASAPASQPVLTKPPVLVHFSPAIYPESEKGRGVVEVVLLLYIDAEGAVTRVEPRPPNASSGAAAPAFVDAAKRAAAGLRFSPAEVDGKPSAIGLEYRYVFTEDLAAATQPSVAASEPATEASPYRAVLKGEIREAGTRMRVPDVTVRVLVGEVDREAVTDEQGRFAIAGLPSGRAKIAITGLKYRRLEVKEKLEDDVETTVKLYIKRVLLDPYETIITGKKETKEVTKRVLSRAEIEKIPGALGDPLRVVQNLPGVARPPLLSGQLVVRGTAPSDSVQYVDGMELPQLYHFGGGPSVITDRMIDDVTFIPGGFGARYGRAIAGVVDIKTRTPNPEKLSGKLSADLGIASLFLDIPVAKNTSVEVAARRSYYDAILPLILPAITKNAPGNVSNPILAPVFWDYQLRVTHHTTGAGTFDLFWYGSDDRFKFVQTPSQQTGTFNPSQLNLILTFHSVKPTWTWKISPKITNTLSLIGTYKRQYFNTPEIQFDLTEWQTGLRDEAQVKLLPNLELISGVDVKAEHYTFNAQLPILPPFRQFPAAGVDNPVETPFKSGQEIYEIAWYGELDGRVGKLRLIPGLRLEAIGYAGRVRQSLQPRLAAKYALTQNFELKMAVGLYQKRPPLQNILQQIGNPDLGLEAAGQATVGGEWQMTQALSLETSLFYSYLFNGVAATGDVKLRGNTLVPTLFDNRQQGRVVGLELLLRHKPYKNFFGWIAYTLSRSERLVDKEWFLFQYDQTHILTVIASYILPYGFQIGARFRLVTGNPTTPVRASLFDADTNRYSPINGPLRSARLPAFHQLDMRLDKTFVFNTWQLVLYLDVQNVYNHQNSEFSQYSYDYSQIQYFTGLPILPVIGLQAEF